MTMFVTSSGGGIYTIGAKPSLGQPRVNYTKEARRKTHRECGGPQRDKSRHSKKTGLQAKPNRSRR